MVEAELFEELVQGDARDADGEGGVDEVEQVGAAGVGLAEEELCDGAGEAGQEFAVGRPLRRW
jgi:hypothetical protein